MAKTTVSDPDGDDKPLRDRMEAVWREVEQLAEEDPAAAAQFITKVEALIDMCYANPDLPLDAMRERIAACDIYDLYVVAKTVTHELGMAWTDPRTGVTYPPPQKHD